MCKQAAAQGVISTPLGISPKRSSAESLAPCPGSPAGQSWAWHLAQLVAWSWWQVSMGCRAGLQGFIHCSVFSDRLHEQERGYVSGEKSALRRKLKACSLISIKTPKYGRQCGDSVAAALHHSVRHGDHTQPATKSAPIFRFVNLRSLELPPRCCS